MKTPFFSVIASILLLCICSAGAPVSQVYQFNYENVLGTSFELKVVASSWQLASTAERVALAEIDRLNSILSTYDPTSEVCRWQKTLNTEISISTELFEVLTLFDQWKVKSGGALNASAGIASALWKKASDYQVLPTAEELAHAALAMNRPHWELNTTQRATHLSTDPLVLNSFVKSYIINKVSEKIMSLPGVTGAVINIGGDILVTGIQQETIRVSDPTTDAENDKPLALLKINNRTIATSGNYRRGFQVGEQWYSHILDARTAIPTADIISATVIAERATDAGALATAFNILSPEESAVLAKQISGVEYLIITKTGQHIVSTGWNALQVTPAEATKRLGSSNGEYELAIELELARFEGRFRRPFVAVWVEDKKKESIRTLAVWYNKSRWLPDLKRWYSKNQPGKMDPGVMESISSATRSAGKYTLTWDGLDDRGKQVPSGKYTIYIEAAREHGTYQLIKQEVEWNGKPKYLDLAGGIEITSASLDYHKVKN
jgi:FAD:protein FMN transferase